MWKCSCPVAVLLSPFKVLESDFSTGPAAASGQVSLTVTYYKFRADWIRLQGLETSLKIHRLTMLYELWFSINQTFILQIC